MKKIFFILLNFFIILNCFSQDFLTPKKNVELVYKEIFESLNEIDWDEINNKFDEIRKNGWKKDGLIISILDKENKNIEKFIQTFNLEYSDFNKTFDPKLDDFFPGAIPKRIWTKLRDIGRLSLIEAKRAESEGEYLKSLNIFKAILKLSDEVQQIPIALNYMIGIALKNLVFESCMDLLANVNISKLDLQDFYNVLLRYGFNKAPIEVFKKEKELNLNCIKKILESKKVQQDNKSYDNEFLGYIEKYKINLNEINVRYYDSIFLICKKRLDCYYEIFKKAINRKRIHYFDEVTNDIIKVAEENCKWSSKISVLWETTFNTIYFFLTKKYRESSRTQKIIADSFIPIMVYPNPGDLYIKAMKCCKNYLKLQMEIEKLLK